MEIASRFAEMSKYRKFHLGLEKKRPNAQPGLYGKLNEIDC